MFKLREKWQLLDEIIKRFKQENLLDEAWKSILKMVDFDAEMFAEAHSILRKKYSEQAITALRMRDQEVNKLHKEVRQNILTHLVVSNRYKTDISFALGISTIVNGLERIGDNCKNIADLAMISQNTVNFGEIDSIIVELENKVFHHFEMLKNSFSKNDNSLCKDIMMDYRDQISIPIDTTITKIIHGDFSDLPQKDTVTAAIYLRYLKRIDANQKNVASIMVNPFSNLGYKIKE